ncbi:hypothetical protein KIL84_017916 [Mauremys mutica]|uniref:Recombination activating protein 1 n=1 Tax=Mauremys mutica TaxID=74926 RepID=A0A9D3XSC5_9SAUR|nr:hypothetical protein KIL84_017916 [Mauremys mutica]
MDLEHCVVCMDLLLQCLIHGTFCAYHASVSALEIDHLIMQRQCPLKYREPHWIHPQSAHMRHLQRLNTCPIIEKELKSRRRKGREKIRDRGEENICLIIS